MAEVDGRVTPLLVSVLQTFSLVKATSKIDIIFTTYSTSLHLIATVKIYLNSHTNTKLEPGKRLCFPVT